MKYYNYSVFSATIAILIFILNINNIKGADINALIVLMIIVKINVRRMELIALHIADLIFMKVNVMIVVKLLKMMYHNYIYLMSIATNVEIKSLILQVTHYHI